MAQVQMPDGTNVEMPDGDLDPKLGARLRAFQAAPPAQSLGQKVLGGAQLVGSVALNAIPHGLHGAYDIARRDLGMGPDEGGQWNITPPGGGEAGATLAAHIGATPLGRSLSKGGYMLDTENGPEEATSENTGVSPTLANVAHNAAGVGGDVSDIFGATATAGLASTLGKAALASRAAPAAEAALLPSEDAHWLAAPVAGQSGRNALIDRVQRIGDTISANASGHTTPEPMSPESFRAAREAPSAVYNRAANDLPTGPYDAQATAQINSAGRSAAGLPGAPDVEAQLTALREHLTDPNAQFTGDQQVNAMRELRQEGRAASNSDNIGQQQIGRAKLQMADAIDGHMERNLPAGGSVEPGDLAAARQALAINHTVESVTQGGHVDLTKLATIGRNNPQLLTGGLRTLSDFANEHPDITSLASKKYGASGPLAGPAEDVINPKEGVGGGDLITGLVNRALGITGMRTLARRSLLGESEASALDRANRMFPPRSPDAFAPRTPATLPMEPPPGQAPPEPLQRSLGPLPQGSTPLAQNFGLSNPEAPPAAPAGPPGQIPLHELLSHGVEQPGAGATALSLVDDLAAGGAGAARGEQHPETIPFRPNIEHAAGGLTTAPENDWFRPGHEPTGDLASLLSQRVPNSTTVGASGPTVATSPLAINSGEHLIQSENGVTRLRPLGEDSVQVTSSTTAPEARGQGEGSARLQAAADWAHDQGKTLQSDSRVSESEQRRYADLKRRGYNVTENPHTTDAGTGEKVSASELRGVYNVRPGLGAQIQP